MCKIAFAAGSRCRGAHNAPSDPLPGLRGREGTNGREGIGKGVREGRKKGGKGIEKGRGGSSVPHRQLICGLCRPFHFCYIAQTHQH